MREPVYRNKNGDAILYDGSPTGILRYCRWRAFHKATGKQETFRSSQFRKAKKWLDDINGEKTRMKEWTRTLE